MYTHKYAGFGNAPFKELCHALEVNKKADRRKFFATLAEAKKLAEQALQPRIEALPDMSATMVWVIP